MPKFWDFTNSVPQKRPDESWFCPENVSGPSFPWLHKKKRRALRAKHPLNNAVESHNQLAKAPVPEKPTANVFDRLSTHNTISASKKMHPHLTVEKGRPTPKSHASPQQQHSSQTAVIQEEEQYQLDQDTPAEPVSDRIARIEKELTLNSNAPFKRSNNNEESASQPSKIQKIINAQFSSLSSSLSFKQDIPRSRPATAAYTITSMKPTTKHPTQVEPAANIKVTQPASQQHPPMVNRRSLYNELQMQKTGLLQQNERIRSSTAMPSSEASSLSLPRSQAPHSSTTHRRSLYHELQSQKNGPSHQKKENPSSTPIPSSRPTTLPSTPSHAPRPASLAPPSPKLPQPSQLPQSQMQPQAQPSSQPQPHNDVRMEETEATQNNDDTATSDFFEDLLKAKREKPKDPAPMHTKAMSNAPTNNFFGSLLKSSQEKYKNDHSLSLGGLEEQENTGESTASFFGNLLEASEKRHAIKPLQQQQQVKVNANVSNGNFASFLKSSQEKHKQNHSSQTGSQTTQEKRDELSGAPSIDMEQSRQQTNDRSPSLPPRTAIAIGQHKENVPESVLAKAVPFRPTQMYATPSKQIFTLQEDKYFTDERIAKARKALRESRERTRKWLEALSPNQPVKH
ncbi:hypothetical protein MAM1_0003d00310 [Mucor ambiguus]|uniref:Uncharacterized protein n=1 Tax=Mucor ambiguus TaxID=91626 RepID=A0A0C9M3X7_9FUNG|nr:hypothetical protein MAM1_0003d00310 [Mucor ambiguus]